MYVYIHTYMLFITLGDGPMDPLPRPPNQPIDPAHPCATDRVVDPHAPSVTDSFAPRVDPRVHRVDPRPRSKPHPNRADVALTEPIDHRRPQPYVT
jgi:hypothetical protein